MTNTSAHPNKWPIAAKPVGLLGRLSAIMMALAQGYIYKHVAQSLKLQSNDDFLEVGCGSGAFIRYYVPAVHSIKGLDFSPDMVDLSKAYNHRRIKEGIAQMRLGDAAQIPWDAK